MTRWLCAGVLLLAGCQGVVGPARRTCLLDEVDDPRFTIPEQQQRARDRVGLPETSPQVGPPTGLEPPSQRGVPQR